MAKKSTSQIHGTVIVQQCRLFVSDPVELWAFYNASKLTDTISR